MSHRLIAAAAVAVLALQGCAQKPVPPTVAVDDFNEGIAKSCTFSPVQPVAGTTVEATVTMTNDGWCAYRASEKQGQAFSLGLVKQRPEHGELQVRKWNGETRAEYYPAGSYTGADRFTIALRPTAGGADLLVRVAVTVTQGAGAPAAAAAPAENEKPAPTTRSRSTRSSTRKRS